MEELITMLALVVFLFVGCYLISYGATRFNQQYTITITRRQPVTASFYAPPAPTYPMMQARPYRPRIQRMASASSFAPRPHIITDAVVWRFWEMGVLPGNTKRAHLTRHAQMTYAEWSRAYNWLRDKHLIDRNGTPLVSREMVRRGTLVY